LEIFCCGNGAKLLEILPRSEAAVQFRKSFGIGACLRWPVLASLWDEDGVAAVAAVDDGVGPLGPELLHPSPAPAATLEAEASEQVASTKPAAEKNEHELHTEVLSWLGTELNNVVDPSVAEALSMCVEVILFDESTSTEEAWFQAVSFRMKVHQVIYVLRLRTAGALPFQTIESMSASQ